MKAGKPKQRITKPARPRLVAGTRAAKQHMARIREMRKR